MGSGRMTNVGSNFQSILGRLFGRRRGRGSPGGRIGGDAGMRVG